jgi:6-phospho-beta-glucosidase
MPVLRFAVLGGSSVATPELCRALLNWPGGENMRPEMHLVLIGRSASRLEQVRAICARMLAGTSLEVTATTDWHKGLAGADVILNQMRVGGLQARAFDETFPHTFNLPGEETIGPGGFANALRTLPVVLQAMHIVEEVAPGAQVLNLTNPAGIVQHAVTRYTGVRMLSLCDSPITLGDDIARLLALPRADLEIDYLGMNHLGWALAVRRQRDELMDAALARLGNLEHLDIDVDYIQATRAIPLPYVRYYLHPERMLAQQRGRQPRAHQLQALEQELLQAYTLDLSETEGRQAGASVTRRGALWYKAIVVPVLAALWQNRGSTWVVNVTNGQLVPWLPQETIVEVPARIDSHGVHPLPVPAHLLAPDLRTLLAALATYEDLAVPAIVEKNYTLALQALVAHPLIPSLDTARRVLDAVWPTGGI